MTMIQEAEKAAVKIVVTMLLDQGVDPKMIRKQMAEWNKRKKLKFVKPEQSEAMSEAKNTPGESSKKEPTSTSSEGGLEIETDIDSIPLNHETGQPYFVLQQDWCGKWEAD